MREHQQQIGSFDVRQVEKYFLKNFDNNNFINVIVNHILGIIGKKLPIDQKKQLVVVNPLAAKILSTPVT